MQPSAVNRIVRMTRSRPSTCGAVSSAANDTTNKRTTTYDCTLNYDGVAEMGEHRATRRLRLLRHLILAIVASPVAYSCPRCAARPIV